MVGYVYDKSRKILQMWVFVFKEPNSPITFTLWLGRKFTFYDFSRNKCQKIAGSKCVWYGYLLLHYILHLGYNRDSLQFNYHYY